MQVLGVIACMKSIKDVNTNNGHLYREIGDIGDGSPMKIEVSITRHLIQPLTILVMTIYFKPM